MNVLFEIGHPAHVHFFGWPIRRLIELGHSCFIVTRNKEITNSLLDRMKIPYECLSKPNSGKIGLLLELVLRWWRIFRVIRIKKIDLVVSISGISTSLPSTLCGVRNLNFTDTEDAKISNWIAFPFSDRILTPQFFLRSLGPKHRRYNGLHELAYLQRDEAHRRSETRTRLGLPEKYSIIRTVAHDAVHDWSLRGISGVDLENLIQRLECIGSVFVTSQAPLSEQFKRYRLETPIEDIHAVLEGAQIFIGESPTMAVESSLLGTPAFLISERIASLGNMVCLERDFGLLRNFSNWKALHDQFPPVDEIEKLKIAWIDRAQKFRKKMPDMADFILNTILTEGTPCAE